MPGWDEDLPVYEVGDSVATRKASNAALQAMVDLVPGLTGGGADLTGNTGTVIKEQGVFSASDPGGRQIYFGVREHAMGAIANGMALHGGAIPVVGTFLVFADYMRAAVRLAALSEAKALFVWTHDSVGVGEDGPTHQPVEHLASLRAIPGLRVIRPADANEAVEAWKVAVGSGGPTALIMSRQNLPVLAGSAGAPVGHGAYVLQEADDAQVTLVVRSPCVSMPPQFSVRQASLLGLCPSLAGISSPPPTPRHKRQSCARRCRALLSKPESRRAGIGGSMMLCPSTGSEPRHRATR